MTTTEARIAMDKAVRLVGVAGRYARARQELESVIVNATDGLTVAQLRQGLELVGLDADALLREFGVIH